MLFRSKKSTSTGAQISASTSATGEVLPPAETFPQATAVLAGVSPANPTDSMVAGEQAAAVADPRRMTEQSHAVMRAFGSIVTVMMHSAAHRDLTVAGIEATLAPAVATGQYIVAEATHQQNGQVRPVAYVLWGSFSSPIDRELQANPDQPFPNKPAAWLGGDVIWITDAAGDATLINKIIEQQQASTWKERTVRMRTSQGGRIAVQTLAEARRQ
ncbi:MAG: toxin-activating lysine-acyltransferase [Hyphomicrobiaceae bacterium]